MGLFTDPNDPTNTYGQAVKDRVSGYAQKLGEMLLNKGSTNDATAQTQMAYKQYAESAMSQGQQPLPFEQWVMMQQQMR